jgi:hypothetical protein
LFGELCEDLEIGLESTMWTGNGLGVSRTAFQTWTSREKNLLPERLKRRIAIFGTN